MMKRNIDIVLLPSQDIADVVIEWSETGDKHGTANVLLSATDRVPHLSMLMGVLEDEQLPAVKEKLDAIAKTYTNPPLTITGYKGVSFDVAKTDALMDLHEALITEIDPLLTHDGTLEYFHEEPGRVFKEKDIILDWVNNFVSDHSYHNFDPHITVHSPEKEPLSYPISFTPTTLALYHLGDFCTCRTLLHAIPLT